MSPLPGSTYRCLAQLTELCSNYLPTDIWQCVWRPRPKRTICHDYTSVLRKTRRPRLILLVSLVRFARPIRFPSMPVCPKRTRRQNASRKSSTSLWTNTVSGRNSGSHICTPACCRIPAWKNNYDAFIGMWLLI